MEATTREATMPPPPRRDVSSILNVLSPFRTRNFSLLVGGRFTSNIGRTMREFGRAWLVLELTGSPFLLGLVSASLSFPMLFMPFLGGVLADRMDRRKLLICTELALVVLWAGMSTIITLGLIKWWHLMISAILSGMIQSIGRPGHQALVGSVVEKDQLSSAVAIDSGSQVWTSASGLTLATVLIATIGTGGLFWISTIGQSITVFTLLLLQWKHQEVEAAGHSARSNLFEGFKYIQGEPILVALAVLAAASSIFAGSYGFLMPFFARDILGVGAQGMGVLQLSRTAGAALGALVVVGLSNLPRRGMLLMIAAFSYVIFIFGFSRSELFYLSLGLVFGIGVFATFSQTMKTMLMQLMAPDHLRGRVMSLNVTVMGLHSLGVLMMGVIAEYTGAANTVLLGGALFGLASLIVFAKMPVLRNFR